MCQLDLISLESIVCIVFLVSNAVYIFVDYFSVSIFGVFKLPVLEIDALNYINIFFKK